MVICPVDCIFVDPEHEETAQQLQQKYSLLTGNVFDPALEKAENF